MHKFSTIFLPHKGKEHKTTSLIYQSSYKGLFTKLVYCLVRKFSFSDLFGHVIDRKKDSPKSSKISTCLFYSATSGNETFSFDRLAAFSSWIFCLASKALESQTQKNWLLLRILGTVSISHNHDSFCCERWDSSWQLGKPVETAQKGPKNYAQNIHSN